MLTTLPFWRLSAFYLLNCAVLGAIIAHWPLYLRDIGLTPLHIGFVISLQTLTTVVAPYFWFLVSKHTGHTMLVVQWGNVLALALFSGVLIVDSNFWWIVFLSSASSFCWQGLNSQFEVFTLRKLGEKASHYSQIRLWGSVGFILSTWLIGRICDEFGIRVLPVLILCLLALLVLVSFINQSVETRNDTRDVPRSHLHVNSLPWLTLCLVFFLVNFSHGAYYGFYSIMLMERGVDNAIIGNMWSAAVLAELVIFATLPWILRFFSIQTILLVSIVFTAFRWWGIGHAEANIYSLLGWQLAHGLSFSAVHTCAILLIKRLFTTEQQARNIAIYTAFCIGAGQAFGIMMAGTLWHKSATTVFELFAIIAALALPIAWWTLRRRKSW